MKTSSRSLFHLIHSLSREEKNYVLRRAIRYRKDGKNILTQLFAAIEESSAENYNEKEIAKKIPNLSVRKKELFESILNSLADRETKGQIVVMLGKLRSVAMLHYRKFFPEALASLTEVEEWALAENQPYIRGVILQYRTLFANAGIHKNIQIDIEDLGNQLTDNAKTILLVAEIFGQYLKVSKLAKQTCLLRSGEEIEKVTRWLNLELYSSDVSHYPISSQCYFHLSHMLLFQMLAQYENAYSAADACWIRMNRADVDFPNRRPQEYLTGYISNINACIDMKGWRKCKELLPTFEKLVEERYGGNWFIRGKCFYLKLKYYYYWKTTKIDLSVLEESENLYLQKKEVIDPETRRGWEYLLTVAFLDTNNLEKSWNYCQTILNAKATAPRRELYDIARIIFLIILFESKKFPELDQQCNQFNRFIRKKGKDEYLFEHTFIKHLRKAGKSNAPSKTMKNLRSDLLQLAKREESFVKQFFHFYNFDGWTTRKMNSLP